ncbi:MAG: hypothetical protein M1553_02380 [Firmicutes bacterium]|nr:hypothetical protein [Bacillota bacterium]
MPWLAANDFSRLLRLSVKDLLRVLLGLLYERDRLISCRAIEALALVVAEGRKRRPEMARDLIRRLLWSLNDESGGTGWNAPQAIGAIIATDPAGLAECIPILFSFREDPSLTEGVLWGLAAVARARPDLVRPYVLEIGVYLCSPAEQVRAHAWWVLFNVEPEPVRTVDVAALSGEIYWRGEMHTPAQLARLGGKSTSALKSASIFRGPLATWVRR